MKPLASQRKKTCPPNSPGAMCSHFAFQQVHLCCTDLASRCGGELQLSSTYDGSSHPTSFASVCISNVSTDINEITPECQVRAESGYVNTLEICNHRAAYQQNRKKQCVREEVLVSICPRITQKQHLFLKCLSWVPQNSGSFV